MAPDPYFNGYELLFKTVEGSIHKNMDVIMSLIHFVLVRHANMRCLGLIGDQEVDENDIGTELLPTNWNANERKYGLRYRRDKTILKLLATKSDDMFIINLVNLDTQKASNLAVSPDSLVKAKNGKLMEMIPNALDLSDRIRTELLSPEVFTNSTASTTTQTEQTQNNERNWIDNQRGLLVRDPFEPPSRGFAPPHFPPFGIPGVGIGDLDPLGRGGPGNLFPSPSHPDMRSGLRPRFDPFGPPERGVRPNPNPDHLQPPSFGGDHYYM